MSRSPPPSRINRLGESDRDAQHDHSPMARDQDIEVNPRPNLEPCLARTEPIPAASILGAFNPRHFDPSPAPAQPSQISQPSPVRSASPARSALTATGSLFEPSVVLASRTV